MNLRRLVDNWHRLWFEPSSPTPIALYRIFLGLVMLQDAVLMRLNDWRLYYSAHPLIPVDYFISYWWGRDPRFDIMSLLPTTDGWHLAFLTVYVICLFLMTIGLFTRTSAFCAFLLNESLFNQFLLNLSGADVFLKLSLLIIALSNSGDAFSFDNVRRTLREDWRKTGFKPALKPQWALRMMQVQVAYVYFITSLCKLGEPRWVDGTALYYVVRYEDLYRLQVPFLFSNIWTSKILDWLSLAFECSFPYLVWIKETRYFMLLWGTLFHIGIDWSVNIPLFEWIFIGAYVNYIAPADLTRVWNAVKRVVRKLFGPPHPVRYSTTDINQIKLAGVLHRLDIFARLAIEPILDSEISPAPARASSTAGSTSGASALSSRRSMIILANNKMFTGFQAFKILSLNLPLLWILVPLLYIPGLSIISRRVFKMAAGADRYQPVKPVPEAVGIS